MKKIFAVILSVLLIYGCSAGVVVHKEEAVSRTYFHLNLEALSGTFESKRDVGGEHIDKYDFTISEGSIYEVSISSVEGNIFAFLETSNRAIWTISKERKAEQRFRIHGKDIRNFEFSVMAHPVDTYTFRIYKVMK